LDGVLEKFWSIDGNINRLPRRSGFGRQGLRQSSLLRSDSEACCDPPRRRARLSADRDPPLAKLARDQVLRRIAEEGRYAWRVSRGATRQSLAENAVSRFKALVGVKLAARRFESQQVEALVKCQVLNRMAALGLPASVRIQVA
jgi:hypothetical protein